MRVLGLYDIDQRIKIDGLKEVKAQRLYKTANVFHPEGLFSEEIFGQTETERMYRCGYIKLPLHVFNPNVAKNIIGRSGGIIRKMAYGEVHCNLVDGVLVATNDGKYCGLRDLYNIWDDINITKTLKSKQQDYIDILTKTPKNLLFNDKVIVLPPNVGLRKLGEMNGRMVKSQLNTIYMHILGLKSVTSHTTSNTTYDIDNKFQDAVIDIYTLVSSVTSGKHGFMQKQLLAKNTMWVARNVISAPRYNKSNVPIGIYKTGYPLDSVCSMFNPIVKFHLKQILSYNNIMAIHPNKNEVKSDNIINMYDDAAIDSLIKIFLKNHGNRFKILYLDPEETKPIIFEAFDTKTHEKISRPMTLTDVIYLACMEAVVFAERTVYVVRYPIGDALGAFFTFVHLLSTNDTTSLQFNGVEYDSYPIIDLEASHLKVATLFAETVTPSNSRLKSICGDYDGDTIKSVGIWSDESNAKAKQLMKSKIYNVKPNGDLIYDIGIECVNGLFALTKDPVKK